MPARCKRALRANPLHAHHGSLHHSQIRPQHETSTLQRYLFNVYKRRGGKLAATHRKLSRKFSTRSESHTSLMGNFLFLTYLSLTKVLKGIG